MGRDGYFRVKRLLDGGAAKRSGEVEVGDMLLDVGGVSVFERSVEQLSALVLGPRGSTAEVGLMRRRNGATVRVKIVRTALQEQMLTDVESSGYSSAEDPMRESGGLCGIGLARGRDDECGFVLN